MGFLKGLGIGGGAEAAGGGSNFLAKLFGTSPENMSSIANRIGMGANQIAEAGGAQAGYQPSMQALQTQDMNNFLMQLFRPKTQAQQSDIIISPNRFNTPRQQGMLPQNMSWYTGAQNA